MIGVEFHSNIPALGGSDKSTSLQMVNRFHEAGLLVIPSGTNIVRILPALNLKQNEADEGLGIFQTVVRTLAV
jgi:acetylornithine/succinyldiaminopimelate/putrescine aminotransferase